MKFVTFNLRADYGDGADGGNAFCCRQPLIAKVLQVEQPDFVGFQEVLPAAQRWLRAAMPGYTVLGCGRGADLAGEAMTIAVRDETLELLGWDTFWLSPAPAEPGSRYRDQSDCPRCCAVALLRDAQGRMFRAYNTHLDHIGAGARRQGIGTVLRRMQADAARRLLPAVLMGDFNASPGAPELAVLAHTALRDVTAAIPLTFHDYFRSRPTEPACKIDYLYAGPEWTVGPVQCWDACEGGVYLSDHYPVCAELTLP